MPNKDLLNYSSARIKAQGYGEISVPIFKCVDNAFELTDVTNMWIGYVSQENAYCVMRNYPRQEVLTKLTIPDSSASIIYYTGSGHIFPQGSDLGLAIPIGSKSTVNTYLRIRVNPYAPISDYEGWKGPASSWTKSSEGGGSVELLAQIGPDVTGILKTLGGTKLNSVHVVPNISCVNRSLTAYNGNPLGNYIALTLSVIVDKTGKCLPVACRHWPTLLLYSQTDPNLPVYSQSGEKNAFVEKEPSANSFGIWTTVDPLGLYPMESAWVTYDAVLDKWFNDSVYRGAGPGIPIDPDTPIDPEPDPGTDPGDNPYNPGPGGDGGNPGTDNPTKPPRITGLSRLFSSYVLDIPNLNKFALWLWQPNIFEQLERVLAEPLNFILGLYELPYTPDCDPATADCISFGNLTVNGVTASPVNRNYKEFNFTAQAPIHYGNLKDGKYIKSYLDFAPFTDIMLYLPYCGTYKLDTDIVMGKTVSVLYRVDVLSGGCVAEIMADGNIFQYATGTIGRQLPVTAHAWGEYTARLLSLAASIGTSLIAGGAVAAGSAASEIVVGGEIIDVPAKPSGSAVRNASIGGSALAQSVTAAKPAIMTSGQLGSSLGMLASNQLPFLYIKRPNPIVPDNQASMEGFAAWKSVKLGNIKGYTRVADIHLSVPGATVGEIAELERLLKTGVIL